MGQGGRDAQQIQRQCQQHGKPHNPMENFASGIRIIVGRIKTKSGQPFEPASPHGSGATELKNPHYRDGPSEKSQRPQIFNRARPICDDRAVDVPKKGDGQSAGDEGVDKSEEEGIGCAEAAAAGESGRDAPPHDEQTELGVEGERRDAPEAARERVGPVAPECQDRQRQQGDEGVRRVRSGPVTSFQTLLVYGRPFRTDVDASWSVGVFLVVCRYFFVCFHFRGCRMISLQ
mmetsp:Transcript_10278/g.15489  ORF Transcript_10278/g.15489 Transcript_10278/m.15489 type:complete len:232 (+) Transcript_10278:98-793(+)